MYDRHRIICFHSSFHKWKQYYELYLLLTLRSFRLETSAQDFKFSHYKTNLFGLYCKLVRDVWYLLIAPRKKTHSLLISELKVTCCFHFASNIHTKKPALSKIACIFSESWLELLVKQLFSKYYLIYNRTSSEVSSLRKRSLRIKQLQLYIYRLRILYVFSRVLE